MFDDTPRDEMRRDLLAEVRLALTDRNDEETSAAPLTPGAGTRGRGNGGGRHERTERVRSGTGGAAEEN